ncbi:MAG TPA: DUF58 domain-containing protein [Clostridiaceae bacterium]|nr:DUF58 domain-containing protein [Clostridiaceae bacterium]
MFRLRFVFWLIAVAATFIGNQLIEHKFIMILMLFLLSLPIFSILYGFWIRRKLIVKAIPELEFIERGQAACWYIRFTNLSKMQTMALRIMIKANTLHFDQDQIKSTLFVSQNSYQDIRLTAIPTFTGPFTVDGLSVTINDIFGFFRLKSFSANQINFPNVYVLPLENTGDNYHEYLSNQLEAGEFPTGKSQTLLDEIDRLRTMENGDSMKFIHWKLSARMQEWMVKEFDKEDDRTVTILLNLPEVFFKTYNKESNRLLYLRNFMLDHTYSAIKIFLSQEATVRLKTYQPELVVEEAIHMNESDLLRKQLAFVPYRIVVPFSEQLHDERLGNEQNILYIITHELNHSLVADLRALRTKIGSLHLVFAIDQNSTYEDAKEHIEHLSGFNINVEIAHSRKVNSYAE